jgi:hypothetical protein
VRIAFPGESAEYRAARDRLLEQEIELRRAEVTKDDVVVVRGLGLTFYDVCARLTADRGGKFVRDETGTVVYEPSGEEPQIYAGSRSGLPFPARGVNQKELGDTYQPVCSTAQKVDELRARRKQEHQDDRLVQGTDPPAAHARGASLLHRQRHSPTLRRRARERVPRAVRRHLLHRRGP